LSAEDYKARKELQIDAYNNYNASLQGAKENRQIKNNLDELKQDYERVK
jgi:hypothetical protein